jgi:phage-related minor tail protein
MGQCKSKDWDFKSYANAVLRRSCCCLSESLRAKTLREIKGNMGQWKSEHQDFKKAKEKMWDSAASLRKETLNNRRL